jgi:hypothetical protein
MAGLIRYWCLLAGLMGGYGRAIVWRNSMRLYGCRIIILPSNINRKLYNPTIGNNKLMRNK